MNSEWKLDKIELGLEKYGPNEGKYVGSVRFSNNEYESFNFKIPSNMAQPFIDLIAHHVADVAETLGERIANSLGIEHSPVNLDDPIDEETARQAELLQLVTKSKRKLIKS